MTSILLLPDEVLEIIVGKAKQHLGINAWCRLTTTCRRLRTLQLPDSCRACTLSPIYLSGISIKGLAWALHRVQLAPSLVLSVRDIDDWNFEDLASERETISSLQEHVGAAAAASRKLCRLQVLELEVIPHETDMPERVKLLLQQWTQALLLGALHLEALIITIDTVPCPPVLGCLSKLRYLELRSWDDEAWLTHFFIDLSFCSCLESLRISGIDFDNGCHTCFLPEVQLAALPRLKRIELDGWLPQAALTLPPECELCVHVLCDTSWEEQWKVMQRHLIVLSVGDMSHAALLEWPRGLRYLTQLQYFRYRCDGSLEGDLAMLKAIPHVYLSSTGRASLTLTEGRWESLEVHGRGGLCITFADAAAFVRGTKSFLFVSTGNLEVSQPMCTSITGACGSRFIKCYQWRFKTPRQFSTPRELTDTVRVSNCEEVMRLEPSRDGKLVPSGGLHDGYAGTLEDSPLWECLAHKSLVSQEQFWPEWDPAGRVLGL